MSEHDIVAALGGISDEKLTDAMNVYERKRKKRPILYRVAAIAAAVAILIGCIFFPWQMFDKHSIFTFTVSAAEMENKDAKIVIETSVVEPYVSGINHPKDGLPDNWHDKELFCVKIRTENFTKEHSDRVYAVIDFNGKSYKEESTTSNLGFKFPYHNNDKFRYRTLCTVYGWTEKDTAFTVTVYDENDGEEAVLFQETFHISFDENYVINGATTKASVDPALYFKTTGQIVDQIINDEDLPSPNVFSDPNGFKISIFKMYSQEISVLYQRNNAKDVLVRKLISLAKKQQNASPEKQVILFRQVVALHKILSAEIFVKQLTPSEINAIREVYPIFLVD